MDRVWHPFHEWEDLEMWSPCDSKKRYEMLQKAIEFTGSHTLYGKYMMEVLSAFPKACEHNLTDVQMNRKAWIGHAACFLAIQCPEDITRQAWSHLTDLQRELANLEAENAINLWVSNHARKNRELDSQVGKQRVFEWHT